MSLLDCVGVRVEQVRATVKFSGLTVKTPFVRAFNVDKARGKLASTFSASLEVSVSSSFIAGSDVEIFAGEKGNELQRFTGIIKSITVSPSFDKAGYYILNISGADRFCLLEGKTFSRRLKSDGFSSFVTITGGPQNRPSRGKSVDKRIRGGQHQYTSYTPRIDPSKSEHSDITYGPRRNANRPGEQAKAVEPGSGSAQAAATANSLNVHDHSELSKGGPAFGVFSE